MRLFPVLVIASFSLARACASPSVTANVRAAVTVEPDSVAGSLNENLFGVNVTTGDKARMGDPSFVSLARSMGVKSCRFPNGCEADRYNWKSPSANQASVEEFLEFCEKIGAEAYYTVNMQGGTEGLDGPAPEGSSLNDRIKYKHLAPNPCGNTNYHFGTLAETLELVQKHTIERALAGRTPITVYEMGNENWGQATTDWPPEVYARTVEVYAAAMRKLVAEAAAKHEQLKDLRLYIVAVGFPVMGNNMKLVDTPDRKINLAWTAALNRLHDSGVIDAVQEHFYPYGSANGGTIAWAVHNLHNIIWARRGRPNSRLAGYRDAELAYNMPLEHTEWNVKCWGGRFNEDVQLANSGFETGLDAWTADATAGASAAAKRRGNAGCLLKVDKDKTSKLIQVFSCPDGTVSVVAGVWIRTRNPEAVRVSLKQANDGQHVGRTIGEYRPCRKDTWERVMVGGRCFEDTREIEFAIEADGPVEAHIDEVRLYLTTQERGQVALSATTFEQQLFFVDAIREMAAAGCPRAHLHHLCGDYPCGAVTSKGEIKDLGKAFQFFADAYGDQIVKSDCACDEFSYRSSAGSYATDFNALAPDRDDIPILGCLATRKGDRLHILLINRTPDREIEVKITLGKDPSQPIARVRTLSGEDIDLPGAVVAESEVKVSREFERLIAPFSAQIISLGL